MLDGGENALRKLMWFAIGFTIACALGAYFLSGIGLLIAAVISALASIFCLTKGREKTLYKIIATGLLGCFVGIF